MKTVSEITRPFLNARLTVAAGVTTLVLDREAELSRSYLREELVRNMARAIAERVPAKLVSIAGHENRYEMRAWVFDEVTMDEFVRHIVSEVRIELLNSRPPYL